MFWRRRKLPEDEPLVPHGLISQAMEEEASSELPPDMWDNSPEDVQQSPAEPVEMRLRVSAPVQSSQTEPLPEQGKISPPLQWPRVDEAEIARRAQGIDTAVSFPYRQPIVSAAAPDLDRFELEPEPEITEPAKLELVETSAAPDPVPPVSIPSARSEKFRDLLSRMRELRPPTFEPLRQKIHSAFSRARTSAIAGVQAATNLLQEVRSKSNVALDAAKIQLVDRSHAAIAQSRSGLQHVRQNIRGADLSGASRAWNRVRSWQVTVRIPASNRQFFASLAENAKSSGLLVQQTLQRDSRLWASMGMAALSALLALGFISAVRHYGPDRVEAQPTSTPLIPVAAPTKAAQSYSVVPPRPSTAANSIVPKPTPIAETRATKQAAVASPPVAVPQKKEVSAPGTQKRRVRRNSEEDDYVAKDTYVFYGNNSKRSR